MPPAFQTVQGFNDVPGTTIEIKNMPRVRSQGNFGICAGFSAATIAQKKACDNQPSKFPDCSRIPLEKEISPFSMAAWATEVPPGTDLTIFANFASISMNDNVGSKALFNSHVLFAFLPESCYPFDQVAKMYGDGKEGEAKVEKVVKDIQYLYENNKKKTEATAAAVCEECLAKEVNEKLGTSVNAKDIGRALKERTFGEFLYDVIFPDCDYISFKPKPTFKYFPTNPAEGEKSLLMPKIVEVLKTGNPLNIEGVCVLRDTVTDNCTGWHTFVISGYKKVCSPRGQCRELVKVHNSWGEDWQKKHNDGWLDADSILKNIDSNDGKFGNNVISWLE